MRLSVVTAALLLVGILSSVTAQLEGGVVQESCRGVVQPCGDGWSRIDENRCAKYFSTPKAFNDADAQCKSIGSELVSGHKVEEMLNVLCIAVLADFEMKSFWIGAKRSGDGFVFTDGSEVIFSFWSAGQPDNFTGEEDCVEVKPKYWGVWNDDDCSDENNFICAKNM
ncbi:C-type isolectin Sp-CL4-like [Gasterosteus aculeatus]